MTLTDHQKAELVDPDDGENRAVRYFLMMYGGQTCTIEGMRKHLQLSGFPYWPEWAERDGHLTKGGAQAWIRYLIGLESALSALSAQPANLSAALDALNSTGEECEFNDMAAMAFPLDAWNEFEELLNQFIPESKPAITEARVIELARQAGALKASDIYDKESLIVDAGDLIRFAALLAAEGKVK